MSVSESEDELAIEQMSFAHPYSNPNCSNRPLRCFSKFSLCITTQSISFISLSSSDRRGQSMKTKDL